MDFSKQLNRALKVIPLAQIDSRLDMPSNLSVISSDTERVSPLDKQITNPAAINVNLRRHEPGVAESVIHEEEVDDLLDEPEDDQLDQEDDLDLEDPDKITDDDLPGPVGMPSGKGYTLQMAKDQLDGIIEKWMDLAGNYSEGEQRHNFLEIGERLREISGVLQRDFVVQKITDSA